MEYKRKGRTAYRVKWKDSKESGSKEKGEYYINFPNKNKALSMKKKLQEDFPKAKWYVEKGKKGVWYPKNRKKRA